MKFDPKAPLKNLKGEPFKTGEAEITLAEQLADILATEKSAHFRPLRAWVLAQKFAAATEPFDLDADDLGNLVKTLESNETRSPLVIGQCLEYLSRK